MRSFVLTFAVLAACHAPPQAGFHVAAPERYEVGQEATITIDAPGADVDSPIDAELVIEEPGGTTQRQPARLTHETNRVKLGPAFMRTGRYRVTLVSAGKPLAAPLDIHVDTDHLRELLADTIAEYKAKARAAKSRASGSVRWMQYSAVYEHSWQGNREIEVTIEEPRHEAFKRAWAAYADQGVVQVMENNYVRLREGAETTLAVWTSRGSIIAIRASDLAQLDPQFLDQLFARHPSDLKP